MNKIKKYIKDLEERLQSKYNESAKAYYKAAISGKKDDYDRLTIAENEYISILSNSDIYNDLVEFSESVYNKKYPINKESKRALELLLNEFKINQIDDDKLNRITDLESKITQKLNNYRVVLNEKTYTDNEVEDILSNSTDINLLENIWKEHKKVGKVIIEDLLELVGLRNQIAKDSGYANFHDMSLKMSELDPNEIDILFANLEELMLSKFTELKIEIDEKLSKKLKIESKELMPWHYQDRFFQQAPKIYDFDLDSIYETIDIEKVTIDFFNGHGLPIDDIANKSSLYEKKGKNQHAFMINLDRKKADVRVLCNLKANAYWMNTNLHEFGHAAYEKNINTELYWTLIKPAHIFLTEAIAMMYGRFATNPKWINNNLDLDKDSLKEIEVTALEISKSEQLVFSRWALVMYYFEKQLYENPTQNLNKLWWDLVERYQLLKRPQNQNSDWDNPDWASKYHFTGAPCYYHNYLLGELFASQLYEYIQKKITDYKGFDNSPKVGEFLKEKIFSKGALFNWNELIMESTNEELTPKYYIEEFL